MVFNQQHCAGYPGYYPHKKAVETNSQLRNSAERLLLFIVLRMLFSQVGAMCFFVGLNINKAAFFISYSIQFFTGTAAVGGTCSCHGGKFYQLKIKIILEKSKR
jgi:hypothetical protein